MSEQTSEHNFFSMTRNFSLIWGLGSVEDFRYEDEPEFAGKEKSSVGTADPEDGKPVPVSVLGNFVTRPIYRKLSYE